MSQVLSIIKEETGELRQNFGNDRRTEIWDEEAQDFSKEELTPHADVVISFSDRGYLKRLPIEAYRLQRRGGKGVRGQETREGDAVQQLVVCDTHDWLLFFTDKGRVYRERTFNVAQDQTRQTRGTPVQNLISAINPSEEAVTAVVSITDPKADKYIFMATKKGEIKRMHLSQFANMRSNGLAAFDLDKGDELLAARLADAEMTVIMVTRNGKGVQFALSDVPIRKGRGAGGVRGIRLIDNDELVGMDVANPNDQVLVLTVNGYGKRTAVEKFRKTGRNVQGVIALKTSDTTGLMAGAVVTSPEVEEVLVGSAKAMVYRTRLDEIRSLGRNTQGVKVMTKLTEGDQVISLSAFRERSWEEIPELPSLTAAPRQAAANGAGPKSAPKGKAGTDPDEPEDDEPEGEVVGAEEDKLIEQPQLSLGFDDGDDDDPAKEEKEGED